MGTTHFTGITNASRDSTLHAMGQLDPTKYLTFWDDFIHEPLSTEWTITATSAGSGGADIMRAHAWSVSIRRLASVHLSAE